VNVPPPTSSGLSCFARFGREIRDGAAQAEQIELIGS
jgi:hypothetical protein